MLPTEKFSGGSIQNLLLVFSIIGILLFIATILRLKVNFLRKAFVPVSLTAGIIGLISGPYVLKVFPSELRSSMAALPSTMIVIVFSVMMIGVKQPKVKETAKLVAPMFFQGYTYSFVQFGLTCLLTGLIFTPFFDTNPLFGSVIEIGFLGGHGTAGGMREIFESLGWAAGSDVVQTTATIGLIVGVFGGLILINIGVKKRYTTFLEEAGSLNTGEDVYVGEAKNPSSYATINKNVVEGFVFHAALIGIAVYIGYAIVYVVKYFFHFSLPLFPFAMIGGWILNMILQRTFIAELIDRDTLLRIQGLSMDFLIVAAVASVSIPVILEYMAPLLIACAASAAASVFIFLYLSPRIFKKNWFEVGITRFGASTGVAATGLMLLRTVDPDMKTDVAKIYALNAPFSSPFIGGGLVTSAYPVLIASFGAVQCGAAFMGLALLCVLGCRLVGCWNSHPQFEQRGNYTPPDDQ